MTPTSTDQAALVLRQLLEALDGLRSNMEVPERPIFTSVASPRPSLIWPAANDHTYYARLVRSWTATYLLLTNQPLEIVQRKAGNILDELDSLMGTYLALRKKQCEHAETLQTMQELALITRRLYTLHGELSYPPQEIKDRLDQRHRQTCAHCFVRDHPSGHTWG